MEPNIEVKLSDAGTQGQMIRGRLSIVYTWLLLVVAAMSCVAVVKNWKFPFARHAPLLVRLPVAAKELVSADRVVLGEPSAPHKFVMFGDYQCGPCRQAWDQIRSFNASHPGQVCVYFHDYPLTNIHPRAYPAAVAAELAKSIGHFEEFHNWLYRASLDPAEMDKELAKVGLTPKLRQAREADARSRVVSDYNTALSLDLKGTPSFLLINDDGTVDRLSSLDSLLQEASGA